ncbi:glycyl-tRNA synthetase subunit beta [Proteus mirabilis]|uniref:Glycyl-tRNA synthetase subunit beta n=1 Tax=Proteus mirabilis TaxID=584 RepID=A0A379GDE4_PROMI|nr:glycyl-tRNA synthetase subunit beta [Proteus mirabilis]
MTTETFLVEIGTEELPPKALRSLAESFATHFTAELDNAILLMVMYLGLPLLVV